MSFIANLLFKISAWFGILRAFVLGVLSVSLLKHKMFLSSNRTSSHFVFGEPTSEGLDAQYFYKKSCFSDEFEGCALKRGEATYEGLAVSFEFFFSLSEEWMRTGVLILCS